MHRDIRLLWGLPRNSFSRKTEWRFIRKNFTKTGSYQSAGQNNVFVTTDDLDYNIKSNTGDEGVSQLKQNYVKLMFNFIVFFLEGSDKELQLVLIDTVLLCGNTEHDYLHAQPEGIKMTLLRSSASCP